MNRHPLEKSAVSSQDVGRIVQELQLAVNLAFEECWKVKGKVTFHITRKHNRKKVSVPKKIPLISVEAGDSV